VKTNATVTRILLEPDTKNPGECIAQGVEYIQDGVTVQVLCKKEVLLCAGAEKTALKAC
jgi:hypothetical protein